ncbi:hypothetical protein [Serratia rubidaea]|uniref:Pectate lyase n=1 Tax=Serratia rubidaea TaxID=61652 RepID=A0ABS0M758_SERRU|nr:hypothetical protein [Serratia rubidaea]MBH1928198.1 hypothetical protein [Serratia rubidaea]MBS0974499.1 hypothetical protein [Serratia rubidaea]
MISLPDYADLQTYSGDETAVMIENRYHHGLFTRDDNDLSSPDNGATVLHDGKKRRWKRNINNGDYHIDWWYEPGDADDYALTINRANDFLQVREDEWGSVPIPTTPAGITLIGPGGVRVCKTTANLKLWKNSIDFKGTILDFRNPTLDEDKDDIECVRVCYCLGAPAIYNLRIVGTRDPEKKLSGLCVYTDAPNVYGKPAAQLLVQNVWISNLHKGIVFGNNSYIQSWHSVMVTSCNWPIWSQSASNAGEKIVFYKCLFGISKNYYQGVHTLFFRDCSFDYSGFNNETDQLANKDDGLFDLRGGTLNFKDCHFEWGNEYSRNCRPVFTSSNGAKVKIKDSVWHSVKTSLKDTKKDGDGRVVVGQPYQYVDYFFFDKSEKKTGKCYIDGFDLINADIKKAWSNGHIEMKNIGAPGHINMWRMMYLGDGVNHLPEPTWKEAGALRLNNVYAASGTRISQTESSDLALTLQNGVITATTKTAGDKAKQIALYLPVAKDDLVLWRCTLDNLQGAGEQLDVAINTYWGRYELQGDAGAVTIQEKTCQWGRPGKLMAGAPLTLTADRITAVEADETLPLPEGYANYARILITLKGFAGSAASPASVDISQLLCQRINIVSRNPNKSW